jgi:hypothetical protein
MNRRKDAFLAAARMAPEAYAITDREGGVCTIGSCKTKPGIVTSVVEDCEITLDQRHLDPAALARMLQQAKDASERFATEAKATVMVSESIASSGTQALNYFIAQKYTEAISQFATSPNAKTILFPVEATQLIGTLGGIGELAREALAPKDQ